MTRNIFLEAFLFGVLVLGGVAYFFGHDILALVGTS